MEKREREDRERGRIRKHGRKEIVEGEKGRREKDVGEIEKRGKR